MAIETVLGDIVVELYPEKAPLTSRFSFPRWER